MRSENVLQGLIDFSKKLQDEESRRLFDIRFEYFVDRDIDELERKICSEAMKYKDSAYCYALDRYFERHPRNRIKPAVLFGAGMAGRCALRSLQVIGMEVCHVVDNNYEQIKEIEGISVESPSILGDVARSVYVIVSVLDYKKRLDVFYQLLSLGFAEEDILLLKDGYLGCDYGLQYFDLPSVPINPDGEIFVDAGCYNGMSSYNAMIWSDKKLNKVYAFEPDKNNFPQCEKRIKELGCEYEILNAATWKGKTELFFEDSFGQASKVHSCGNVLVQAESIDNVLNDRPATFIKLDVEGSELESLMGSVKTIQRYKPKLAVSIYHKPEDIVTLPLFIESLNMNYKYYIRHYQTRWCETILYAL